MPSLRIDFASPAAPEVDRALVAFVVDALGCDPAAMTRKVIADPPPLAMPGHGDFSAQLARIAIWQLAGAGCTVRIEREESIFPGDVNEPASRTEYVRVEGTRGGSTVTAGAFVGSKTYSATVEAAAEECERIFEKFRRAFATSDSVAYAVT